MKRVLVFLGILAITALLMIAIVYKVVWLGAVFMVIIVAGFLYAMWQMAKLLTDKE